MPCSMRKLWSCSGIHVVRIFKTFVSRPFISFPMNVLEVILRCDSRHRRPFPTRCPGARAHCSAAPPGTFEATFVARSPSYDLWHHSSGCVCLSIYSRADPFSIFSFILRPLHSKVNILQVLKLYQQSLSSHSRHNSSDIRQVRSHCILTINHHSKQPHQSIFPAGGQTASE